jgi:hypothetical protein
MIFFTQELQDVDEEALTYLQENKSTMLILQINVENVMDFEHFVLDSPKYSPFHKDCRVIVGD